MPSAQQAREQPPADGGFLVVGAIMRGYTLGKREGALSDAHLVGELPVIRIIDVSRGPPMHLRDQTIP